MRLRILGKFRAWRTLQVDGASVRKMLEAFYQIRQARTDWIQVGGIDLRQVAKTNYLTSSACAGNDGFHLVWGQVLTLVNQNQAVLEASTTDVIQ